jgi:hypothetical protein
LYAESLTGSSDDPGDRLDREDRGWLIGVSEDRAWKGEVVEGVVSNSCATCAVSDDD